MLIHTYVRFGSVCVGTMVTWGGVYRAGEGTHESKGERGDVATSPRSNEYLNASPHDTYHHFWGASRPLPQSLVIGDRHAPRAYAKGPSCLDFSVRSVSPEKAEDRAQGVKPESGLAPVSLVRARPIPARSKGRAVALASGLHIRSAGLRAG